MQIGNHRLAVKNAFEYLAIYQPTEEKKYIMQYDPWPGRLTQILLDDNAHYAQMLWKKMT